jgi:hypothetical protein
MKETPYLNPVDTLRLLEIIEQHDPCLLKQQYDPHFGDEKNCECGHPYHRHFDSYEQMRPVGCKYCDCFVFQEKPVMEPDPLSQVQDAFARATVSNDENDWERFTSLARKNWTAVSAIIYRLRQCLHRDVIVNSANDQDIVLLKKERDDALENMAKFMTTANEQSFLLEKIPKFADTNKPIVPGSVVHFPTGFSMRIRGVVVDELPAIDHEPFASFYGPGSEFYRGLISNSFSTADAAEKFNRENF